MGREFEAEASAPSVQDLEPSEAPPSYDQVIFGKNRTYKICQILESRFKVQNYAFYLCSVKSYGETIFQGFRYENVDSVGPLQFEFYFNVTKIEFFTKIEN